MGFPYGTMPTLTCIETKHNDPQKGVLGSLVIVFVISYQLKLIKMRAELANLNHSVVPFLSRAVVKLCWYYYNQTSQ